ncbi:Imm63 family immunity protein [Shewanella sp. SR44-3]|uniref:Imm63 family immunity protein n=1 Tax=Shewanella sp. SR44-3 TaxID=2760936 RepID=UPI0015FC8CC9|nr:Imm63 family immunity protein [Shewanella sp. SR44-3]MBB1267960.1 hypothetical protein [Shewanella sp. SR44-3]
MEAEVRKLAITINAPDSLLRVYDRPKGDRTPHIEIHGDVYHYVSTERGYEIFRKVINDECELFFMIFQRITRTMSGDDELKSKGGHRDCRRIIFSRMTELLGMVDSDWELKQKEIFEQVLIVAPFEDEEGGR